MKCYVVWGGPKALPLPSCVSFIHCDLGGTFFKKTSARFLYSSPDTSKVSAHKQWQAKFCRQNSFRTASKILIFSFTSPTENYKLTLSVIYLGYETSAQYQAINYANHHCPRALCDFLSMSTCIISCEFSTLWQRKHCWEDKCFDPYLVAFLHSLQESRHSAWKNIARKPITLSRKLQRTAMFLGSTC